MGEDQLLAEDRPTVQSLIEKFGLAEEQRPLLEAIEALLDSRLGPPQDQRPKKKGGSGWDMTYKGDDLYLEAKAILANLVKHEGPVSFKDLDLAPRFLELTNIYSHKQWGRFVRQRCYPRNAPDDERAWAVFRLPGRTSARYLTLRPYLHCHIAHVARGRKDAKGAIEETRRKYDGEDPSSCEVCRRRAERVEGTLQTPVSQEKAPPEGKPESPWSEEELTVLQARGQSGKGGD